MTRDEQLCELQKRIALARGYTDVRPATWRPGLTDPPLEGILHADEGHTLVPRWPMDWCDAGVLVEEMDATSKGGAIMMESFPLEEAPYMFTAYNNRMQMVGKGEGLSVEEAIARAWCAWKGIDLSDIQ